MKEETDLGAVFEDVGINRAANAVARHERLAGGNEGGFLGIRLGKVL